MDMQSINTFFYHKELNFVLWKYLFGLILARKIILLHSQTKNSELFSLVEAHYKSAIFSLIVRNYQIVYMLSEIDTLVFFQKTKCMHVP